MKTLMMAALAATSLGATPLYAQTGGTVLGAPQFASYTSRGQCESALAAERNKQRKDATTRGAGYENLGGAEFNHASRTTTRCEERGNKYVVVYYASGFPG